MLTADELMILKQEDKLIRKALRRHLQKQYQELQANGKEHLLLLPQFEEEEDGQQ